MRYIKHRNMILLLSLAVVLILSACGYGDTVDPLPAKSGSPGAEGDINYRELLLAMGCYEDELDKMEENGISLESIYNQNRFYQYTDKINDGLPIGDSGMAIAPEYYCGIYYDEKGILTVLVVDEAFNDAASAIAIAEMRELGIVVKTAVFTDQELNAAYNTLNDISEKTVNAGAAMWGLDSIQNRVAVWLEPYTDEQKSVFMALLYDASIDPAMILIKPALTQEMIEERKASVISAMQSADDRIAHVDTASISAAGILFSLENRADIDFHYGAQWDLAYYSGGQWAPVQYLTGRIGGPWPDILYSLLSSETEQFDVDWEWRFGKLPPGKYAYIFNGYFGEYTPGYEVVYVTVEFTVSEAGAAYKSFIALLADSGLRFTETGKETDAFLSVPGWPVHIGDHMLTVYEYPSNALMEADAACIDIGGCSISTPGKEVNISWVSYPNFFKKGTLIVNYIGESESVLDFLRANFGEPFAGYSCVN